jgi:hypothetical protein
MADAKAKAIMEEAAEGWQLREVLEKRLLNASRPSVGITVAGSVDEKPPELGTDLLLLESASGDPQRIFLGHLRAAHLASSAEQRLQRWQDLARYVEGTMKDQGKLINILESAVRHCPRCKDFWVQLHLEREASGTALSELQKLADRGFEALQSAGAEPAKPAVQELMLQHADACRRAAPQDLDQMRATLQRVVSMNEAQAAENGLACQALLQWMRLEAYAARNTDGVLDVGNRLMKFWGPYYNGWTVFIAAVRFCLASEAYSTVHELYVRANAQVSDYPAQIRSDHVQFERECGTLKSWREARDAESECQQADSAANASAADVGVQEELVDASQAEAEPAEGGPSAAKKRDKPKENV